MNLPEKYLNTMRAMLGTQFPAYLESFKDKRLYGLRVNTLKISVEEFLKISPFALTPIPWIENGFYFCEEDKPAKHPYYFAGLYYIQEPSAMTPAHVLPVAPGDKVLDMCAAPGGKSTALGAKLNRTGLLVANDISASRAKALLKNVEVAGIPNALVINEEPKSLARRWPGYFDKVLIDAPCSGEGMFRKDGKLIKAWEKNGPEFYHEIQKSLVVCGAQMLRPGGQMVYSTCTFSALENEGTLLELLRRCPEMTLEKIVPHEGFSCGFADSPEAQSAHLERAVRIWPHKMAGEGHFVALLKKNGNAPETFYGSRRPFTGKIPPALEAFLQNLSYPLHVNELVFDESRVYAIPCSAPDLNGVRRLRAGLFLGELKKERFEPSQALAMALKRDEYANVVDLSINDPNAVKYLKGETIETDGAGCGQGWRLICASGYPLGWGKCKDAVIKNKYLAGWRWM